MSVDEMVSRIPNHMKSIEVVNGEPELCFSPEGVELFLDMVGTAKAEEMRHAFRRWGRDWSSRGDASTDDLS